MLRTSMRIGRSLRSTNSFSHTNVMTPHRGMAMGAGLGGLKPAWGIFYFILSVVDSY
jgi:hypothetical protein